MAKTERFVLHIGAHKTATTHLQHALQAARRELNAAGVRVFGPSQLRGPCKTLAERFALPFVTRPENASTDVSAALQDMRNGAARLVLSEENYIGVLNRKAGHLNVPLYPHAAERIAALADVCAPNGIDIFLGIRAPAAFLNSVYSQFLAGGTRIAPEEFRAQNSIASIDWAAMIDKIRRLDAVRSFVVWPFEDYEVLFGRITALMVGKEAAKHVRPGAVAVHSGLSLRAVEAVLATSADDDIFEAAKLAKVQYPISPEYPKFDVFDGKDHAASGLHYADQLADIGEMKNVILLRA